MKISLSNIYIIKKKINTSLIMHQLVIPNMYLYYIINLNFTFFSWHFYPPPTTNSENRVSRTNIFLCGRGSAGAEFAHLLY